MRPWLQLVRWPNLVIVALTMYILHFKLLLPYFTLEEIAPTLTSIQYFSLMLMTVFATAAGYVVNDWFDYPIDVINKPERVIINKKITWRKARRFYIFLLVLGALISSYLSGKTGLWGICILYNVVSILLFLYARYLKRTLLIGNFVVALLCTLVPLLVWYVNNESFFALNAKDSSEVDLLQTILMAYAGFSFFITMFREIVKDVEDLQGDQQFAARTLPIVAGIKTAKWTAGFFGLILLFGLILFKTQLFETQEFSLSELIGIALFIILSWSLFLLYNAKTSDHFRKLSFVLKSSMLLGLLWLMTF